MIPAGLNNKYRIDTGTAPAERLPTSFVHMSLITASWIAAE